MPVLSKGSPFMLGQGVWGGAGHAGGRWLTVAKPLPPPCVARGFLLTPIPQQPQPALSAPAVAPLRRLPAATSWVQLAPLSCHHLGVGEGTWRGKG